jgi:hypothetical protein
MHLVTQEYFDWIMDDSIYNQWTHEDYENVTAY